MWEFKSQIGKKKKKKNNNNNEPVQCYKRKKKKRMKISFWDNIYSWFVKETTFPKNKITKAMLTTVIFL